MNPENFVFKGKFFVYSKEIGYIRSTLTDFLYSEGFSLEGGHPLVYPFLSLVFIRFHPESSSAPLLLRVKKSLRLISDEEFRQELYFHSLLTTRDDVPFEVALDLYTGKFKGYEGTIIEVISKPAVYFKITQRNFSPNFISKEKYSFIKIENEHFIKRIVNAVGGYLTEEPKPLEVYIHSSTIEKLKSFRFEEVAKLLENGKKKVEIGNSDGLDDLRAAIEQFFRDLMIKLNEKAERADKWEKDLKQLNTLGYLDEDTERVIRSTLYNGVYSFLSNVRTHPPRKEVDLFTSRLLFNLTEDVFDYLIERIIKFKIKTNTEKGN